MPTVRSEPNEKGITRRAALSGLGVALCAVAGGAAADEVDVAPPSQPDIAEAVARTRFIDTHEHLVDETDRVNWREGGPTSCNDWGLLFSHYIDADLAVAGMPPEKLSLLTSAGASTGAKWDALEPYWPAVKNTGYGRAIRIAVERLYGVPDLSRETIGRVQEGYQTRVRAGFYREVLGEIAGIESCQVNALDRPIFREAEDPTFLMQDISIAGLHMGSNWQDLARPTGITLAGLADYHKAIDWWFEKYGTYAVAVKTQAAYARRLDYADVPAEQAEGPFGQMLQGAQVPPSDVKLVQDHLFWYCVRAATARNLPVKLHTGYYAGHDSMPLARLTTNPDDLCNLLRTSPDTTFVLMHICYPYENEMVAIAKQWHNAVIDMCWAWIISPVASARFLSHFLVTAPANKILTFGGDYIPVEPVVGHAAIARQGIGIALSELVRDGWLSLTDAVELVEPIMRANAARLFRVEEKGRALATAPWRK